MTTIMNPKSMLLYKGEKENTYSLDIMPLSSHFHAHEEIHDF